MTLDIDHLASLARAATPGPWRHNPAQTRGGPVWRVEYTAKGMNAGASFVIASMEGTEGNDVPNAAYIAAADPTTLLALIDRVRRLEYTGGIDAGRAKIATEQVAAAYRHVIDLAAQVRTLQAGLKEACEIAERVICDTQVLPSTDSERIAELRRLAP